MLSKQPGHLGLVVRTAKEDWDPMWSSRLLRYTARGLPLVRALSSGRLPLNHSSQIRSGGSLAVCFLHAARRCFGD